MLLTLTTTHHPATDIGYLLRKNPARSQTFDLTFGKAHVVYPEATVDQCTVALLVEVDPVALVRNRRRPAGEGGALEQYVNDRPYAASSFLSVAIAEVFGSALAGRSKERPDLVDAPLPLRAGISALPCRGGEEFLRNLFKPLGYTVSARRLPLDENFPDWGDSAYHQVELEARLPLQRLLTHLYVLVPVLDNDKHYWVGDDEVEKLLRHGEAGCRHIRSAKRSRVDILNTSATWWMTPWRSSLTKAIRIRMPPRKRMRSRNRLSSAASVLTSNVSVRCWRC